MSKNTIEDEKLSNVLRRIKNESFYINNKKGLDDTEKITQISFLYDEIYKEYGAEAYQKNTPEIVRIFNIKHMIKNETSENEIIKKHGNKTYKKSKEKKIVTFLKRAACVFLCSITMWFGGMGIIYAVDLNSDEYKIATSMIDEQAKKSDPNWDDEHIIAYVLTQLTGLGRQEAKNELSICEFTTIATEGTGVCRNYADYFAELINKINPKYKAKVINTYNYQEGMQDEGSFQDKLYGNHSIVVMQIPEHNLNLIIDPYNSNLEYNDLAIGFLQEGKIYMIQDDMGDAENKRTYFEGLRIFGNNASFLYNLSLQQTDRTPEETYNLVKEKYNSDTICKIMHELIRGKMIEYDELMW